jgi:hypothetical protein
MTQADCVFSTPPLNTSAKQSRRSILGAFAAGSIATLAPTISEPATAAAAGTTPDLAFALIAEKRAADVAHCEAIDAQDEAEMKHGDDSDIALEANDLCFAACRAVNVIDWRLATTPPTTLAGVAAVLRFANEIEDAGNEWPNTDTVGREGWHYQLRATMAAAIEALLVQAGKAVWS